MSEEKKICKACRTEIDSAAIKCPHCHAYQSLLRTPEIQLALGTGLLMVVGLGVLVGVILSNRPEPFAERIVPKRPEYKDYPGSIAVKNTVVKLTKVKNENKVLVLGYLTNSSNVTWRQVWLEVSCKDDSGKLTDVIDETVYCYLKPNTEEPFRILSDAVAVEGKYVSHTVRVKGARADDEW